MRKDGRVKEEGWKGEREYGRNRRERRNEWREEREMRARLISPCQAWLKTFPHLISISSEIQIFVKQHLNFEYWEFTKSKSQFQERSKNLNYKISIMSKIKGIVLVAMDSKIYLDNLNIGFSYSFKLFSLLYCVNIKSLEVVSRQVLDSVFQNIWWENILPFIWLSDQDTQPLYATSIPLVQFFKML